MKSIWKHEIALTDFQEVIMPIGAQPLHVGLQGSRICIWTMVDTEESKTKKLRIYIYGTGHLIQVEDARYMGTVITHGGGLVWHVFYKVVE